MVSIGAFLLRTGGDITEIYMKHVDTVYRIALMILNNVPEAEDATQSAFMKLMTSGKTFESDEHIKAWLIVTTRNACRNTLKSLWRSKRVDIETVAERAAPTESLDSEIWNHVSELSEKHKILVYLHYYEGYKTEEISKMLGINHATVRTRLRAARAKLRLIIEEGHYAHE